MSGILLHVTQDGLGGLDKALARLAELGAAPQPLWQALGQYGESSTRARFKNQKGPDGVAWKPSQRAKKSGGQTLVKSARLLRSITYHALANSAEWGSNAIYARIHQLGGKIEKLAFSSTLRLRTNAAGKLLRQADHARLAVFAKATHKRAVVRRYTVAAHGIQMPARPFLGVNEADGRELLALSLDVVDQTVRSGGAA